VPETPPDFEFTSGTSDLTHIDGGGKARMVDVSGKPWTRRRAVARCRVAIGPSPGDRNRGVAEPRGPAMSRLSHPPGSLRDVFAAARIAGVQAAKETAGLVPLCHALPGSSVEVRITLTSDGIAIEGEATTTGPTGVEMEALTACAFAALCVVSLLRGTSPQVSIEDLALWEKSGGRSGSWARVPPPR
jgi:cyclic pyranopterin monophosphate synthase